MNKADCNRIQDAAKFWAWYHDKRVRIEKLPASPIEWRMRITLIAMHREL